MVFDRPAGIAPDQCRHDYEICLGGEPPPPSPEDACNRLFHECVDLGLPEDFCRAELDECLAIHVPPPCDVLTAECLALGLDPAYCEEQHRQCLVATQP